MSQNLPTKFLTLESCKLKLKSIFACFLNSSIKVKICEFSLDEIRSLINTNVIPFEYKLTPEFTEAFKKHKIVSIEIAHKKINLNINVPINEKNEYMGFLFESTIYFLKIQLGKCLERYFNENSWEGSFKFSFTSNHYDVLTFWYTKNMKENVLISKNEYTIKPVGQLVYKIKNSVINKKEYNEDFLYYDLDENLIFTPGNSVLNMHNTLPPNSWGYSKILGYNLYFNSRFKIFVKQPLTTKLYKIYNDKLLINNNSVLRKSILFNRKNTILSAIKYFLPLTNKEKRYFHPLLTVRDPKYLKYIIMEKIYVDFEDETVQDEGSLLKDFLYETIETLKENKRIYWNGEYHKFNWTECLCVNNECSYCFRESLYNFNTEKYVESIIKLTKGENKQIKKIVKNFYHKKAKEQKEATSLGCESDADSEIIVNLKSSCKFESKNLRRFFVHLCMLLTKRKSKSFPLIINTLNMFKKETRKKFFIFLLYFSDEVYIGKYLKFLNHSGEIQMHELIPSNLFFELLANLFILAFLRGFNIPLYLPYSFYCTILGIKTPITCLQNKQQIKLISEIRDLDIKYISNPKEILQIDEFKNFSWIVEFLEGSGGESLLQFLSANYERPQFVDKHILKEFINYNLSYLENYKVYNIFFNTFNSLLDLNLRKSLNIHDSFSSFMNSNINDSSQTESGYINFTSEEIQFAREFNPHLYFIYKYGRPTFSLILLHTLNSHNLTWTEFLKLFKFENSKVKEKRVIKKMFEILEKWFFEEENIMFNTKIVAFFKFVLGKFPNTEDEIIIKLIPCPLNTVVFRSHNCFNTLDVGDTNRFDLIEDIFYESVFGCKEYTFA